MSKPGPEGQEPVVTETESAVAEAVERSIRLRADVIADAESGVVGTDIDTKISELLGTGPVRKSTFAENLRTAGLVDELQYKQGSLFKRGKLFFSDRGADYERMAQLADLDAESDDAVVPDPAAYRDELQTRVRAEMAEYAQLLNRDTPYL